MRCHACGRPSDQLRHVEHHRRSGFGYRTTHAFLCPACAPAPVAPAGVIAPPANPPRGEGAGAVTETQDAPRGQCAEAPRYPTPSAATSAESAEDLGTELDAPVHREDETAGRDRHFEAVLGTKPEFLTSVTAQQLNTEGPNHEVAVGDGAVIPAHICAPLGMCPGSNSGPGYTSPGEMVGRAGSGRAA